MTPVTFPLLCKGRGAPLLSLLAEAGRRLGPQCRQRIVTDRGQFKREGSLLLLLPSFPCLLVEPLVGGNSREAPRLSNVERARVLMTLTLRR